METTRVLHIDKLNDDFFIFIIGYKMFVSCNQDKIFKAQSWVESQKRFSAKEDLRIVRRGNCAICHAEDVEVDDILLDYSKKLVTFCYSNRLVY